MPAKAPAAEPSVAVIIHVPLDLIAPSPRNPRKRFNAPKLAELAETIKRVGVFTPVILRANPDFKEGNGRPRYELVAGERRWRASRIAGAATLPGIVRDLNDYEAAEIQLIENVERESLHPLEEAEGLRSLLAESQLAHQPLHVTDLAAKLSKSERWVYKRLELLTLCDEATDALSDERIGASMGNLIATLPDHDNQRKALKYILQGFNGEPLTYRAAAEYVRKEFMLNLAHATFSITALYAVDGPCTQCTKRTGAKPGLFDDGVNAGDLCQDATCYDAKTTEAHAQLLDQCRQAGHEIVQGDRAKKLLSGEVTLPGGHFKANEPCPTLTLDKRVLFDIFGPTQKGFVTVEHPTTRALTTLVPAKIVKRQLEVKKLLRPAPEPVAPPPPAAAPPAAAKAAPAPAAKPTPLTAAQRHAAIETRTGVVFSRELFVCLAEQVLGSDEPPLTILRSIAAEDLYNLSAEAREVVQHVFQDLPPAQPGATSQARSMAAALHVSTLDGRQLADLIAVVRLAEELSNGDTLTTLDGYSNFAVPMAKGFGIDLPGLEEQAVNTAVDEVDAEEAKRLGTVSAGDAFAGAVNA